MGRLLAFLYGVVCYAIFFLTFLYSIGFVGNLGVPKGMDSPATDPFGTALLVDLVLLGIFAIQHSVMARPGFKRWWTKIVPTPVERSTYVLLSSLALILLYWQWRPLGGMVWDVENELARTLLWALFWIGWGVVLVSTFLIDHFDLFGLRQVWLYLSGQPYTPLAFRTNLFYRWVRHPIMVGFIIAFWATPHMSLVHLLFAVATTAYILIAVTLEERDLVAGIGAPYEDYRRRVRAYLPFPKKS